jgi:hypothetical protein
MYYFVGNWEYIIGPIIVGLVALHTSQYQKRIDINLQLFKERHEVFQLTEKAIYPFCKNF